MFTGTLRVKICEASGLRPTDYQKRHEINFGKKDDKKDLDPYVSINVDDKFIGEFCAPMRDDPAWGRSNVKPSMGGGREEKCKKEKREVQRREKKKRKERNCEKKRGEKFRIDKWAGASIFPTRLSVEFAFALCLSRAPIFINVMSPLFRMLSEAPKERERVENAMEKLLVCESEKYPREEN